MSRASLLALALGLAAASVCPAGIYAPTNFFEIRVALEKKKKTQYVCVTDGRLTFVERMPWSAWEERHRPGPDRWYVMGTNIKTSLGRYYLTYDPSGKDNRVFLSRTVSEGTSWRIGKRKEAYGGVQAGFGKVKGWSLDVEEYEEKGKDGGRRTAYRLILRKDVSRAKVHVRQLYAYR